MHPQMLNLITYLRTIPNLNRGGCAYAALAMYKYGLRLGLNVHMMYTYGGKEDYETNCLAFNDQEGGCECMHAVCVIDNEAYDSIGYVCMALWPYKHFVPEYLVRKTLQNGRWNPEFDRNTYVPLIEAYIGESLIN